MSWGAIGGAAIGATASYLGSKQQAKAAQQGATQQVDPRIASILFGDGGSSGLLNRFQGLLDQPQTLGSQVAGQLSSNYLAGAAPDDVTAIRNASLGLINNQPGAQRFDSPGIANPLWVTGERINAPSQGDLNLSPAFQNFIYGNAAENPYLLRSLGAGVDLASAGFRSNVGDITDALQRNVLPGIRGGAIMSGQYGGSRQGIAEGNALSDFTRQLTNAANQQGLAQTQGILGAQTQTFNQGQDRALAALTNLSGQQFGRASQEAQMAQQAQLANQAAGNEFVRSNQAAQLQTNALNSQNALQSNAQANAARIAGTGALSGLLGQMYGYNQNAQNADLARAQGVSGLLSPFIGVNQSTTQPVYQNTGANVLGGAAAGLGLYNQFRNSFGTPGAGGGGIGAGMAAQFPTGY